MLLAGIIVVAVLALLIAGLVERGYVSRFWTRSSRLGGRGSRYDDDHLDR